MAMLKIDIEGIIANATPPLKQSITCLDSAQKIISSINIPSDFSQASAIKGTITTINSSKAKINDLSKWVTEAIQKYNEAENKNKSILDSLFGGAISDGMDAVNATISGTKKTLSGIADAASNVIDRTANIFKTGAKVAKKFVSSAAKKIKSDIKATKSKISKGFKFIAKKAREGAKRVVKAVKTGAKVVKKYFNAAVKKIKSSIKETKSRISKGFKFVANKVTERAKKIVKSVRTLASKAMTEINHVGSKIAKKFISAAKYSLNREIAIQTIVVKEFYKQTKSLIADVGNTVVSIVKGGGKLIEALADAGSIIQTAVYTPTTLIWDAITYGASIVSGKSDKWKSGTAEMWKNTMSFVAEQHVENAFKAFYKNNSVGKWLDENAHSPFKSDGIVSDITTNVGYAVGVVVISILTAGIATPFITGGAAFGQSVEKSWSNAKKSAQKGKDWRTFGNGAKGIGYGAVLGIAAGLAAYAGGKVASMDWSKGLKVAANTATNQANMFTKMLTNAAFSNKSFSKAIVEAWNKESGWRGIAANFGVALVGEIGLSNLITVFGKGSTSTTVTENSSTSGTESSSTSGTGSSSTSGETTEVEFTEQGQSTEIGNQAPNSPAETGNTTSENSTSGQMIEQTKQKTKSEVTKSTIENAGTEENNKKKKKESKKNNKKIKKVNL